MSRTVLALLAAVALVAASCGDDDDDAVGTTTTSTDDTATTEPSTTSTTGDDTDGWTRCENPDGFSLAYPPEWETNDGTVVGPCSQFDPDPFEVPEATDERVAAITAYVDPVPFAEVAAPGPETEEDLRSTTAVDGQQAVRIEGTTSGLYPEGTESVRYVVNLTPVEGGEPRTLFLDTVGLTGMDFEANVRVLDRMARTLDLDDFEGTTALAPVVARYGGGGTPFSAGARADGDARCILVPLEGDTREECFDPGGATSVRVADLSSDLLDVLGGATGRAVFRVDAEMPDGTFSFLPVAIPDTAHRGFAMPVDVADVTTVAWYDIEGEPLGVRQLNDEESGPDAVGAFDAPPRRSAGFPGEMGSASFLSDVRVAAHAGFDRLVFELEGSGEDLQWEVEVAEELVAPSGEEVPVEGEHLLRVVLTPASRVDLRGSEAERHYDGPERIDPTSSSIVQEVALVEDFENFLVWGVGLDRPPEVAVAELEDPLRLVIDIESAGSA